MSGTANRREKKRRRKDWEGSKHPLDEDCEDCEEWEECEELPTRFLGLSYDGDAIRASLKEKDDEIARLNGEVARLAECKSNADGKLEALVVRMQAMAREHEVDRARREKELNDVQEKIGAAEDRQEHTTAQLAEKAAELVKTKEELESCKQKIAARKHKCATLKEKLAGVECEREHYKHNEQVADANAKLAAKQIAELRRQLETERKLGVAEGKGEVAATSAVVKQYESEMRKLHQKNDQLQKQIENMMPVYNTASAFAAAVHGGVPVQKSIADDGPVIREVEA